MLSSHTPVGWLEIRLPPASAFALAAQSGFTYALAPAYGLSTCGPPPPPLLVGVGEAEVRLGVGLGELLVRLGVGEAVVGPVATAPVQVTPFRVNEVGTGFEAVHEPLKPGCTDWPVPSAPFQDMLVTVTARPDWLNVPFQPWVTAWPAAGNVHFNVQAVTGS